MLKHVNLFSSSERGATVTILACFVCGNTGLLLALTVLSFLRGMVAACAKPYVCKYSRPAI